MFVYESEFWIYHVSRYFHYGKQHNATQKNPDIFELIRGKCNILQGVPTELTLLTNNLPSGYHREMQLIQRSAFPAINTIKDCLYITEYTLNHIQVKIIFWKMKISIPFQCGECK